MKHREEFSRFVKSIGCSPDTIRDSNGNPLIIDVNLDGYPFRLVVYMFSCIDPPGGRPSGEYKISMCLLGQKTGMRCNFAFDKGFVLLVGYVKAWDVYVLWDAYKHLDFAYRSNAQVKQSTILDAFVDGISVQIRKLRKGGEETVICCNSSNLEKGILMRYEMHQEQVFQNYPKVSQSRLD